jgi:hypothetical protein
VDVAVRLGDVLYRSDRTRIERVDDPEAGPCVRKEFAGPDARARLRREVAALRRLEGVAGVPGLLAVLADDGALLLEDLGEEVLQRGGLREPDEVRRLAAGLAETLADVHERQVLHLDINPSNAVLTSRGVALIDFDVSAVASGPAREVPRDVIGGTLAYMAPEQTGRTGRPVDERSDLYALGGTMYELATGHPPLTGTDSLRLIRDQLAGTHVPVQTLNPRVPDRLRAIIDRLLNKDPELRYQSASGLAHDLRAPLTESSPLGQGDFPARLAPPPRVIGRRAEQDLVRAAFDGMLTGRLRGIMVAGPGGIGKTSLIGTLRPVVAGAGGRFVTGKYDQYRQDQSSDAVVHALRGLARLLATSPNDELVAIRARLAEAGVDGASVTALVPEFGALVGDSGGIEPRSDEEARSRFVHSATAVLQAVVSHRRPLVVVLDDLQWSSTVGIDLLDAVFLGGRIDGLLIAGAYRDAEIGPTHPLFALLEKWRTAGVTPEAITLHDLPVPETETLPAEMMRMPESRPGRSRCRSRRRVAGSARPCGRAWSSGTPRPARSISGTTGCSMFGWIGGASVEADAARPAIAEPAGQIAAELILRMLPAAFFGELDTMPWLVTAAQRLWTENGPHPALIGSLGHAGIVGILTRENYAGSYAITRFLTAVADARGWAAEAGLGRFLGAVSTAHWFEPIEDAVQLGRTAREALLRDGDMQFACATYHATVPTLLDCAGSLDDYADEVAAAVAFGARTGNEQAAATIYTFRLFVS